MPSGAVAAEGAPASAGADSAEVASGVEAVSEAVASEARGCISLGPVQAVLGLEWVAGAFALRRSPAGPGVAIFAKRRSTTLAVSTTASAIVVIGAVAIRTMAVAIPTMDATTDVTPTTETITAAGGGVWPREP